MNVPLILLSVCLNCAAQLLMKKGMAKIGEESIGYLLKNLPLFFGNVWLWLAVGVYGLSFVLWLAVLSKTPVSVAFPFLSVGYVVVVVCGHFLFGEAVSPVQIAGLILICGGVVLISRG